MMDNLPELRDIHLPEGVSAFPPAYGWGVILVILIGIYVAYELWRMWQRKSKKLYALRLLHNIQGVSTVVEAREMSEILRRICVFKFPQAASLFGNKWIDFLNLHCKEKIKGTAAQLLIDAPYIHPKTKNFTNTDAEKLRNFCKIWIGENL